MRVRAEAKNIRGGKKPRAISEIAAQSTLVQIYVARKRITLHENVSTRIVCARSIDG
jgi:hypothetical protein